MPETTDAKPTEPSPTARPSKLKAAAKPLLALFAMFFALGIGEIAIRVVGLTPEVIPIGVSNEANVHQRSTNPILSYVLKPNYRSETADGKHSYPYTNAHGFRDHEREYTKPKDVKRILIVGDSVVVGHGVREIEDLMTTRLQALYPENQVEVLNLAVAGYCTRAEVELLKEKGLKYDPDLVILVFVQNDFTNFQRETQLIDGIRERPESVKFLFQHSHLFRLACLKLNLFSFGAEADPAKWNQQVLGDNNVDEGLQLLRRLAEENEFETLVAIWPLFTEDDIVYGEMMKMPEAPEELIVHRIAQTYGLQTVRLDNHFRKHWSGLSPRPNPIQHYTIGDSMHPSPTGHQVAAEIFKQILDEQDLLAGTLPLRTLSTPSGSQDSSALEAAKEQGSEEANYADLYFNQGLDLKQAGKLEEAIGKLAQAVELAPADADYRNNYGNALRASQQYDEARTQLEKAIELAPTMHQAHFNLALLCRATNDSATCKQALEATLEIRPDFVPALLPLAEINLESQEFEQAAVLYHRYVNLVPEDKEALSNLGAILLLAGHVEDAITVLELAHAKLPEDATVLLNLAEAHFKSGNREEGLTKALQALSVFRTF